MDNKRAVSFIIFIIYWYFMSAIPVLAKELAPYQKYQGPIKAGVVIDAESWDKYLSELKKLCSPSILQWYGLGVKGGMVTISIVEKGQHKLSKGVYEATRKYSSQCRIGPNNSLIGWKGGIPFPDPKSAIELAWDCYPDITRGNSHDDLVFYSWFGLFKGAKYEKHFRWVLRKKKYVGRTDIPPIPHLPEFESNGVLSKESMLISEPHEVRGFIQLRIRYWDVTEMDECYGYIPAIRRIRRLTGADVTDPILGSDCINDDFEVWRQKFNPKMTFRVIGNKDCLFPREYVEKPPYNYLKNGPCSLLEWEIRPMWILEVMTNDPQYPYSRRLVWVDKEHFGNLWGEAYDQRGRLWRANGPFPASNDGKGFRAMFNWMYMNCRTNHYTMMEGYPTYGLPEFKPVNPNKAFTIKGLLRMVR